MFRLLLCSILLVSAANSYAQSITGRVVDPDGRPVAGVTVMAIGVASAPLSTTTDEEGQFSLGEVADGRYDITASTHGLFGEARGVTPQSAPLTIAMRVSAVSEAVVVSAAQIDQPLSRTADSVTVISGRDH